MFFFKLETSPILGRNKSILCLSASNSLAGAGCSQRYYKFMLRVLRLCFNSLNVCKENFVAIFFSFLFLYSPIILITRSVALFSCVDANEYYGDNFLLRPLKSESHTKIPTSTLSFLAKGVGWCPCPYIALFSSSIAHMS